MHLPRLGGLRHARKDSINTGWRNASFRGFADYMQTDEFEAGLDELRELTRSGSVALMCAEAVPWRCHRSLVADALTARGAEVEHITSASHAIPHRMTPFAKVHGQRVTYPPQDEPLETRAPFHLEATVRVLQRRPANLVDVWRDDRYLRLARTREGLALVEVVNRGTVEAPDVRWSVREGDPSAESRRALAQTLRRVLGLDVNPLPLQRRAEAEPQLRATARALRGMRPPRFPDLFETFANVVPFQQLSLDAGVAIVAKLVARFGEHLDHDGGRFHAFPTSSAIASARLDALGRCGLSRHKAEALRALARAVEAGDLGEARLEAMSTDEALRALAELPGIGRWSASLVLLRGLGRLDVFPPGDVGVARGLLALAHLRSEASLERIVMRFGSLRGYLYFCALGGNLLRRGLIRPSAPSPLDAGLRAG